MKLKAIILLMGLTMMSFMGFCQTTTKNYVMSLTARDALQSAIYDLRGDQLQVQTDIVYIDGLGRTLQEVMQEASPNDLDIVKIHAYDAFGRQDTDYLPYEAATNNGSFQGAVLVNQSDFYSNPPTGVANISYPYSQIVFENSPLNRPLETSAAGTPWRSSVHGGAHTVNYEYRTNAADEIRLITVDQTSDQNLTATSNYAANQLRGSLIFDEDGKQMLEYVDKTGKVVCKINAFGTAEVTYTYYVYDNFDRLTFVIPPEAIATIGTSWGQLNDISFRSRWLFRYKYDQRHRMIEKQVPGAAKVEMVYDKRDRLVFTLDGNRRAIGSSSSNVEFVESGTKEVTSYNDTSFVRSPGARVVLKKPGFRASYQDNFSVEKAENAYPSEWLYTKYDALNRPVITGLKTITASRASLQAAIDNDASYDFNVNYIGSASGNFYGYDDASYPSAAGTEILTVTYYDNYDFVSDFNWGSHYQELNGTQTDAKGLVTGARVRLLGTNNMLNSTTWYDDRYRVKAVCSENYFGEVDKVVNTYRNDVSPLVTSTVTTHRNEGVTTVTENFTYDHRDRLLTHTHTINGNNTKTLASNTYNAIGQLIEKDLDNPGTPVQSVDYRYNERGWLTTINGGSGDFDNGEVNTDQFGMELKYHDAPNAQYNGNIGQMLWKSIGGGLTEASQNYQYTYDNLNRLTSASYSGLGNHNVDITYDKNGNIETLDRMKRVKLFAANGTESYADHSIDQLSYTYTSGNQLSSVADDSPATGQIDLRSGSSSLRIKDLGFEDGSSITQEYGYDSNGNMTSDTNKGITEISYNYLNLPELVEMPGGNVSYVYDAAGIKHRKTYNGKESTYVGTFHYERESSESSSQLEFIQHSEGRAVKSGSSFNYEYHLKDHLGNIRVTVDESGTVKQRQDYYPFGLTFNGYNQSPKNNYLYNRKERDPVLGWDDFHARKYDPALGRWNHIDPLADQMSFVTPYAYGFNNPVLFIDPDGKKPIPGPFTGRGTRNSNGTIRVYRITPGQRQSMDVYKNVVFAGTGLAGTVASFADAIYNPPSDNQFINFANGMTPVASEGIHRSLVALEKGYYAGQPPNYPRGKWDISSFKGLNHMVLKPLAKGIGYAGIGAALMSSDPTSNEFLEHYSFQFGNQQIKGSNINIAQEGLFEVNDDNASVEYVESALNTAYIGLSVLLQDYDLGTKKGREQASLYLWENRKIIRSFIQTLWQNAQTSEDDEESEDE